MKTTGTRGLIIALTCCILFSTGAVAAERGFPVAVGLGFDYATGDYGTDVSTDTYTSSVFLGYFPTDRLNFELAVPYIRQSSSTTVSAGGIRFPITDSKQPGPPAGMGGASVAVTAALGSPGPPASPGPSASPGPPGGAGGSTSSSSTGITTSKLSAAQQGLGDLALNGGYVLFREGDYAPQVRPTIYIKFPTADENKLLGTGELDLGVGLELSKRVERWYLQTAGSYISQGSNDLYGLKNFLTYEIGAGYLFTDRFSSLLSLWGATPPSDFSPSLLEAQVQVNYQLLGNSALRGYIGKGFTDGSSDFGTGVSINFYF